MNSDNRPWTMTPLDDWLVFGLTFCYPEVSHVPYCCTRHLSACGGNRRQGSPIGARRRLLFHYVSVSLISYSNIHSNIRLKSCGSPLSEAPLGSFINYGRAMLTRQEADFSRETSIKKQPRLGSEQLSAPHEQLVDNNSP